MRDPLNGKKLRETNPVNKKNPTFREIDVYMNPFFYHLE